MWDLDTGRVAHRLVGSAWSLAFSPDGTRLVVGGSDGTVRLWDAGTGTCVRTLEGHTGPVVGVTWRAAEDDGGSSRLASASADKSVRIWDARTGAVLVVREAAHADRVASLASHPTDDAFVSGGFDATVRVWDWTTGAGVRTDTFRTARYVACVAVGGAAWAASLGDNTVALQPWHSATAVTSARAATESVGETSASDAATTGGSATTSEVAGSAATVGGEEAREPRPSGAMRLTGHSGGFRFGSVSFSPDGRRLASRDSTGEVRVWSAESGALEGVLRASDGNAVVWTSDHELCFPAEGEATCVAVWNV